MHVWIYICISGHIWIESEPGQSQPLPSHMPTRRPRSSPPDPVVCACVCVREREIVCVCVCERERERERDLIKILLTTFARATSPRQRGGAVDLECGLLRRCLNRSGNFARRKRLSAGSVSCHARRTQPRHHARRQGRPSQAGGGSGGERDGC